jgi:signal peptidase I
MQPIQYFLIISVILLFTGLYKIFEKAGEQGWKAFVPVYHFVIWLKILKKPWWWIFLILIPTISWLMLFILFVETSKAFGKRTLKEHLMALIGYFIYLPMLGFSKTEVWTGPPVEVNVKKSLLREWGEAGLFAVVAATIIRTFFFEAFTIPTSSLEKSLLVGDYLFVSKISYGAKVPNTPLSFPFAHNTMPFTETVPSFLNWIKLPNFRLPGLGKVQRNDYVVFNWPEGDTVELHHSSGSYYELCRRDGRDRVLDPQGIDIADHQPLGAITVRPVDKLDNYVKRCVVLPGDKFEIKNKNLFVNDQPAYVPPNVQYSYIVDNSKYLLFDSLTLSEEVPTPLRLGKQLDITDRPQQVYSNNSNILEVQLTAKDVEILKQINDKAIWELCDSTFNPRRDAGVFPRSIHYRWTKDNYGPLVAPKEGATIPIDTISFPIYERIIGVYEGNKVEKKNGVIFINGKEAHSYTFKQNYYFMLGDNRHNSLDSRYWGFVPEDHIVGKPVFIWMSIKKDLPFLQKFRWKRFFTFVQSDHISKSYFLYFLLIGGGLWAWFSFRGKKKESTPVKEILNKGKKK